MQTRRTSPGVWPWQTEGGCRRSVEDSQGTETSGSRGTSTQTVKSLRIMTEAPEERSLCQQRGWEQGRAVNRAHLKSWWYTEYTVITRWARNLRLAKASHTRRQKTKERRQRLGMGRAWWCRRGQGCSSKSASALTVNRCYLATLNQQQ